MSQDGHLAWWHHGDPVLGLGPASSPVPAAGRGLFLPVLCPCSGFVEGGWVPLGVSPPHPTGYSDLPPSLLPPAPFPAKSWLANGLMWEISLCASFSHCYSLIQGHPRPGTALLLGTSWSGQRGAQRSSHALAQGWPRGSVWGQDPSWAPPEHPWCWPTHVAHLRTILKEFPCAVRGCARQLAASERLVGLGAGWAEGVQSHWHDTAQPLWLVGTALTSVFTQELETPLQAHHLHTSVHPRDEPPLLPCS